MFGLLLFSDGAIADYDFQTNEPENPNIPKLAFWVEQCPAENNWTSQQTQVEAWTEQNKQVSEWNNQSKHAVTIQKCNT